MKLGLTTLYKTVEEKNKLKSLLIKDGFEVLDFSPKLAEGETADYSDTVKDLAEATVKGEITFAIAICKSGFGMSIMLNRFDKVLAIVARNDGDATMGRKGINANAITFGTLTTSPEEMVDIIKVFINTDFDDINIS
ncbi:MAG: RpiB/LacA/LacB family sugar-phosphate isomerase [Alphaproteobacteria bacterium]|nr:RpiB/LacA/LacB family sugar-phosphate isomerase [Alphaproteobacteria bacterium]